MCGFVGYVNRRGFLPKDDAKTLLTQASNAIVHRGPDDGGAWVSSDDRVGLGFRRLSILDLTNHGHQPMTSSDGHLVIAFNGEIYNFKDLRKQLDAEAVSNWQSHSDTEVLLEMIRRYGVEKTVAQVDGMFAFAVWNAQDNTLTLARDRFGEKPLYYGWSEHSFVFGSELKALKALPGFKADLDPEALALYFRYRYVPGGKSIYAAYNKLEAGTCLTLTDDAVQTHRYWDPTQEAQKAFLTPFKGTREEALDDVSKALETSVSRRLDADVPLGVFLSGGIDSSLVAAYAQKASSKPINTFTIGFEDKHFNEAPFAKAIADRLGTHHTCTIIGQNDEQAIVNSLAQMYDEPFADPSQLPTAVLCHKAREHVTVALAGDGGDELFCGYGRYLSQVQKWQNKVAPGQAEAWLKHLPVKGINAIAGLRGKPGNLGHKWFTRLMDRSSTHVEEFFMFASSFWRDGVPVLGFDRLERDLFAPESLDLGHVHDVQRFQALDTRMYLPDDVLVKTDRASMAASLEVRTPFLNLELARLAWSLPFDLVDPATHGLKSILKDLLARHIPREEFERPKQGFDAPIRQWLRGDLKSWGEALVMEPCALATQYLDMARIQVRWAAHQKGLNVEGDLWPALVLLAWMRTQ
ncbi:MAG: asparagine synthase (glutamine-hydrolyzing) [Magnetovibrio sp.]|nr:asparagine synthase (glutamine-hydrolyzing) [Magnetovibrio sp.]